MKFGVLGRGRGGMRVMRRWTYCLQLVSRVLVTSDGQSTKILTVKSVQG